MPKKVNGKLRCGLAFSSEGDLEAVENISN